MKYLLPFLVSLAVITRAQHPVSVNSLLTSQALHAHPLANPVVPLTANGVAAAHAAAEVLHIDEVLHHGPPPPIPPVHDVLHHAVAAPAPLLSLHHDLPPELGHHHLPVKVSVSHHPAPPPLLHGLHGLQAHDPLHHAKLGSHLPTVHHSHHHYEPLADIHAVLHHPEPHVAVHHAEPLVRVHHHHDPYEVHHEVAHLDPHHGLVAHTTHHETVHHGPHHALHHEVAVDHLVVPHRHGPPPLLHPPSLAAHAPLGACSPLCSVLDLVVFHPQFTTLVSLVRAAGLVELLSQPGPITLFAPTNAAFDAIAPGTFKALLSDRVALQSVLLRHVTRGALHSADFPPGPTPLVTGAGERVTVTAFPNQVTLTSVLAVASIIDVDNVASNGVVHVVDSVF